jgi:hypothetical protein
MSKAAATIGVSRQAAHKRTETHPDFKERFKEAEAASTDRLVGVSYKLAAGEYVPTNRKADAPNADILKFLLRAHRPEVYRENIVLTMARSLADIRGMTPEERQELGRELGVIPRD